jgi:cytochrome c-type biogenesis protein CcmF
VLDVSKHGRHVATLQPSEGFYAAQGAQGTVSSLIGGQPVSHIAMNGGITRDVWSAIAPNIEAPVLKRVITAGNETLQPDQALVALGYLARVYLQKPPPAQFHLIVSPLVMWIWIGGLIVFGGGLIAIWPAPSTVRARLAARSRGRSVPGLARA